MSRWAFGHLAITHLVKEGISRARREEFTRPPGGAAVGITGFQLRVNPNALAHTDPRRRNGQMVFLCKVGLGGITVYQGI